MDGKRPCRHVMCDPDECFVRSGSVDDSEAQAEIARLKAEASARVEDIATLGLEINRLTRAHDNVCAKLAAIIKALKAERDQALTPADATEALNQMLNEAYQAGQRGMRDRVIDDVSQWGALFLVNSEEVTKDLLGDIRTLPIKERGE